tara:strand:+ start:189 stop:1475 length:1287 start_codon:yes stop_codon:yes gene_type:complete
MSNRPILVLKQIAPPAQQFQSIGADRTPSFMDLGRTAFAPRGRVKTLPRIAALLGLGGKVAAGGATALQTAHQLQSGNLAAPLGAQYTYEGYDPSRAVSRVVNPVVDERKQGREAAQQESERLLAQRNQRETAQRRALEPHQITTSTAPTSVPLPTDTGTYRGNPLAPATAPMAPMAPATGAPAPTAPHVRTGIEMSGNQPQQTGPMMPTQAPPAGVNQSLVGQTALEYAGATNQPMQTPGGPAVPQQTSSVQTRLPLGGPLNARGPDMSSAAQQRGPPPSPMDQAMAPQQSMVGVLPPMNQSPSAHSTANPLSQSDINYANEVLGRYHNKLPQHQQASMNTYGSSAVSPHQAQGHWGVQWGQQEPHIGSSVNWNQWNTDMPEWFDTQQKMLKAFISYLYDNMGSYLYKMTPHEAGAFAVDVFFKMRE